MASFWGAVLFVLCYSLFLFSPENADSYLSGYVVAITESESQILSPCCNGGVCFWPSYSTRENINSVPELGGDLLASWSWHWIYIALPPKYLRAVLFCLLSQAICVRVGGILGGIYPSAVSGDSALAPTVSEDWNSRLPLPWSGSVILELFIFRNCCYVADTLRHLLVSAWRYFCVILNRSLLTCLEPGW